MKLHQLHPPPGSKKKKKRVGRGTSSGWGKTAGRGSEGAKQRSGRPHYPGFEGGQMPLYRRLPKRGFHNPRRIEYQEINVERLNVFPPQTEITPEVLEEKGWVKKDSPVKILGKGEIKVPLVVKAHAFSSSARKKIEEAGGKVEIIQNS
ncbi:MAG TPA: 50S ribosomal protein L15 [bacterium]|nr:50S ribosomal protein L15 [bacterium]HEX68293.1 50S ribosomal protein L15 [bacterium]